MKLNQTILKLLSGERVRMSLEDFETLTEYIQNKASDDLYNSFKSLVSYDRTLGTITVLEAELKEFTPA
jgi:hypothetical protein